MRKAKLERDKSRRREFRDFKEQKRLVLKTLLMEEQLSGEWRSYLRYKDGYGRKSIGKYGGEREKIVNRCILTGRSGGVIKYFRLNRQKVLDYLRKGALPGGRRSSW